MAKTAAALTLLAGTALLGAAGCTPARIVDAEGNRVTFAWNSQRTTISRVNLLAVSYCNRWNAPPVLLGDEADGDERRTTFVCRGRGTLPLRRLF